MLQGDVVPLDGLRGSEGCRALLAGWGILKVSADASSESRFPTRPSLSGCDKGID